MQTRVQTRVKSANKNDLPQSDADVVDMGLMCCVGAHPRLQDHIFEVNSCCYSDCTVQLLILHHLEAAIAGLK